MQLRLCWSEGVKEGIRAQTRVLFFVWEMAIEEYGVEFVVIARNERIIRRVRSLAEIGGNI